MTTIYTVQIQGCNADETVWQGLHPAEPIHVTDFNSADPVEIARSVDAQQNIAEGRYRIVLWEGPDADTSAEPAAVVDFGVEVKPAR